MVDSEPEVAIGDTDYADSDTDEAAESVLGTIQEQEAVRRNDSRGTWLVRHEGEVYVAGLPYEGFDVR